MSGLEVALVARLTDLGVQFDSGLTDDEVTRLQTELGFVFGPQHRRFLQTALPVGDRWPPWRSGHHRLRAGLDWPLEGLLFDVAHSEFWPRSWGPRPEAAKQRDREARRRFADLPALVPIYSHRYLTCDPQIAPSPVFSVHQTDVIVYGADLMDYVEREFGGRVGTPPAPATRVPFWSDLARGAENDEL